MILGAACFLAAPLPAHAGFRAAEPPAPWFAEPHLSILTRTLEEAARVARVTAPTEVFDLPEAFEDNPAGAATVEAREDRDAFAQPGATLTFEQGLEFRLGEALFDKLWVFSPSSTRASDGLGPVYNARSCQRCHIRDGRGTLPEGPEYRSASTFLRISIPAPAPTSMAAVEDFIGSAPDPVYGSQLQDFSAPGIEPEYRLAVSFEEQDVILNGGEIVSLRHPSFTATELNYGPLHPEAMLSPRVAPPMIGLGLLEAIPAADILALADPEDADGDGISGRPNLVWSPEFDQVMLGRFGLKAGTATLHDQSAAAFSGDVGISTPLYPNPWGDCTETQVACRSAPHGDKDQRGTEIDQPNMDLVTFYTRNVAVPTRRNSDDIEVLHGKSVFYDAGCIACHRPKFVTHRLSDRSEQSFQLIWPYSDLLLHDMGEGLADHRPEGRATGREWRTPPLWGIGLTQQVNEAATYLHDGRARSLIEAILWHGGEAQAARDHVVALPPNDRAALITFLESL